MILIFRVCKVEEYIKGTLLCPDPNVDPEGASNWSYNDAYTHLIIFMSHNDGVVVLMDVHEIQKSLFG